MEIIDVAANRDEFVSSVLCMDLPDDASDKLINLFDSLIEDLSMDEIESRYYEED